MGTVYSFVAECPSGSFLAYNDGNHFCFKVMEPAACADMNSTCQTTVGLERQLLRITNSSIMKDAIAAWKT